MLRNYVLTALRNARRQPGFTAINVTGLALGFACCLLILLYVLDELTYDRFHENADRIVRIQHQQELPGGMMIVMDAPPDLPAALTETSSGVEAYVRTQPLRERPVVARENRRFYEEKIIYAEPALLTIFDFPLRAGDPKTALARPDAIVLTPEVARKYFGDDDPIGQTLLVNERPLEVTGVFKKIPANSTLDFDFVISFETLRAMGKYEAGWSGGVYETFYLLQPGFSHDALIADVETLLRRNAPARMHEMKTVVNPLPDLHLGALASQRQNQFGGNASYLYIFGGAALLILLLAAVNFINLSTAQALRRAREVGVRKVVGAKRLQLITQFLSEAVLVALLALAVALVVVVAVLPGFNALVQKELAMAWGSGPLALPVLLAAAVGVGLLAGMYPAFVLSAFRPVLVLKGRMPRGTQGAWLRKGLVVFQFTGSIVLLIGVLVIHGQLRHMQRINLGLNPDQIVMLTPQADVTRQFEAFRNEVQRLPGIVQVAQAQFPDGVGLPVQREGETEQSFMHTYRVTAEFLDLIGLELVAGRSLTRAEDETQSILINEAAARELGWSEPVGQHLTRLNESFAMAPSEVVGVVRDVRVHTLRRAATGSIFALSRFEQNNLGLPSVFVKVQAGETPEALRALEATWQQFAPTHPFEYTFMDDHFATLYEREQQLSLIAASAAFLAVLIAALGLLGLAVHTVQQRRKEIGVRKVLGATATSVVALLAGDFVKWVIVAFVLATPAAWWLMHRWLQDFSDRIPLTLAPFLLAGLGAAAVALLAVGYHALRAARTNPVQTLRHE